MVPEGHLTTVRYTLCPADARRTSELTSRQLGKSIDGEVGSAPVVEGPVGARGSVSFPTAAEARRFAASLRSGPLPAALKFISEDPAPR